MYARFQIYLKSKLLKILKMTNYNSTIHRVGRIPSELFSMKKRCFAKNVLFQIKNEKLQTRDEQKRGIKRKLYALIDKNNMQLAVGMRKGGGKDVKHAPVVLACFKGNAENPSPCHMVEDLFPPALSSMLRMLHKHTHIHRRSYPFVILCARYLSRFIKTLCFRDFFVPEGPFGKHGNAGVTDQALISAFWEFIYHVPWVLLMTKKNLIKHWTSV